MELLSPTTQPSPRMQAAATVHLLPRAQEAGTMLSWRPGLSPLSLSATPGSATSRFTSPYIC